MRAVLGGEIEFTASNGHSLHHSACGEVVGDGKVLAHKQRRLFARQW